jgi:hypothetical protein
MAVTMTYGGYSMTPVPLITIGKTYQKNASSIAVGTIFDININGNIVEATGSGGLDKIFTKIRDIRNAFDRDGKLFQITDCTGGVLWECYPRIIGDIRFSESTDKWVFTCPYNITLECDHEPVAHSIAGSGENIPALMPPYIANYEDNWSFEFDDSISKYSLSTDSNALVVRATHEVNAVGKSHWKGPGLTGTLEKPAWRWAEDFVVSKLDKDPINPLTSGVFNVTTTGWNRYNHFRVQKIGESDGTFSVSETFILKNKSDGVLEDFNVEVRSSLQDPHTSVGINGSIQGLEERSYGTGTGVGQLSIAKTKYENAANYWETIKDSLLIYPRANAIVAADGITLNTTELTKIVGRSPTKGQITYSYEYNNRPSNCITGSKVENIQIQDDNPVDVFSRITIMGRAQGPILQSFNTITDFKRTVSLDVIMTPPTGCSIVTLLSGNSPSSQVSSILCSFEQDLKSRYTRVLKERDSVSWEPKSGHYNRVVSWAAVPCTSVPPISLCSGA